LVGPKDPRKFCEKILWYGPIANRGKQAVLSSPLGHSPVHEIIDKELKIIAALLSVKSENGTAAIHPFVSPARTLDTKPVCLLDVAVYRYVVCSYYMAEWKHGSGSHPDGPLDPLGSQSSIFCQRGSAKRGSQGNSQDRSAMLNTNVVIASARPLLFTSRRTKASHHVSLLARLPLQQVQIDNLPYSLTSSQTIPFSYRRSCRRSLCQR